MFHEDLSIDGRAQSEVGGCTREPFSSRTEHQDYSETGLANCSPPKDQTRRGRGGDGRYSRSVSIRGHGQHAWDNTSEFHGMYAKQSGYHESNVLDLTGQVSTNVHDTKASLCVGHGFPLRHLVSLSKSPVGKSNVGDDALRNPVLQQSRVAME